MDSLGLPDAPLPIGRALDLAFLCGEPVGTWEEIRVGDGPVRRSAHCTDLSWVTGLWGRRGDSGHSLLAYLDPAPDSKEAQDAAARQILRERHGVASLRLVMRDPSGRYRVVIRDGPRRVDRAVRTIEMAARSVSGGRIFF